MNDFTQSNMAILNYDAALARFGGDKALFCEIARILLDDAPQIAKELRVAVECREATAIRSKAHALKGLVLGCGGERAGHAAQILEDAGYRDELEKADAQLITLEHELNQLLGALGLYVENRVTA